MFTPETRPIIDARGISSFIGVPLRVQKHVIGGLTICRDPHGALYTHDDQVLLQDLADRAALTIQNARLFEQVREARQRLEALSGRLLAIQEEERRTIARELHDEVGQALSGWMMQLGTVKSLLPKSAKSARIILDEVEALVQQTLESIRKIIAGLRPSVLDDLGLTPAIRRLGSEFQEDTGTHVEMDTTRLTERLPAPLEVALFRIVQEALTNVRKHARAKRVSIGLAKEDGKVVVSVQDDGVGFEKQTAPPRSSGDLILRGGWRIPAGHFGLIGIQERVTQLGGRLDLTSAPGQGTTLRVEIPLPEIKAVSNENP
jgi:two-component system sensor histidine kinase DegS